jgi:predicted transcriptional regulator
MSVAPDDIQIPSYKPKSSIEEKALILLGQGIPAVTVASTLGVSQSRISQLLSQEEFANQVTVLKYENLQKHNRRDADYDEIEDKLLERLKKTLPLMFRPIEILKAIQIINGAKRRGQSTPEQIINQQTIVNLVLPAPITEKFTTNINNQVISAGAQDLLTIQSKNLIERVETKKLTETKEKVSNALNESNFTHLNSSSNPNLLDNLNISSQGELTDVKPLSKQQDEDNEHSAEISNL